MSETRTPEQLKAELYKRMVSDQGTTGEHLCEVAMPGVHLPVNPSDVNP